MNKSCIFFKNSIKGLWQFHLILILFSAFVNFVINLNCFNQSSLIKGETGGLFNTFIPLRGIEPFLQSPEYSGDLRCHKEIRKIFYHLPNNISIIKTMYYPLQILYIR